MEIQESSKCYSGISVPCLFQHPLYYQQQGFLPVILALNLSESESVIESLGPSMKYWHRLPEALA